MSKIDSLELILSNGPNLTKQKKQRCSGRKKGGFPTRFPRGRVLRIYYLNGLSSRARNPRLRFFAAL